MANEIGDGKKAQNMVFLLVLGAFVLIDVLAVRFGFDSRADLPHDEWRAVRSK